MGIDGIGKGGTPPQTPDASGAVGGGSITSTHAPARPFEVERSGPSNVESASGATAVDANSPLGRLRAGEIDVNGYVDLKVDEATSGLHGLSSSELATIKTALRDRIATDPGLIDLVQGATGQAPKLPEE